MLHKYFSIPAVRRLVSSNSALYPSPAHAAYSFTQTNQTQFLNSENLSSVVEGIRNVCALESTLLGGAATADGEFTPSATSNVPQATNPANAAIPLSRSWAAVGLAVVFSVFASVL